MTRTRTARRQTSRDRRIKWTIAGAVALLVIAGVTAAGFAIGHRDEVVEVPVEAAQRSTESTVVAASIEATVSRAATSTVEVPAIEGRTVAEARVVLSAVGLTLEVRSQSAAVGADVDDIAIQTQEPAAGELLATGAIVTGMIAMPADTSVVAASEGVVVCIDPGHQSRSDLAPEPIGPGATETKARVVGGTTGVATGIPEYEIVLQIAMNLKDRLEADGITVVMTRTTNDVNLSNAERARIANESGAALFVRIHADGSTDQSVSGISTLYPGKNPWTTPIAAESVRAAGLVHDGVIASTGAVSRGTVARTDISGFNWAEVPSVLVECGFMSNPVEDKLLASPHYQDKISQGIADGILGYLGRS